MAKVTTVARTEYLNAIRSKAFIIGVVLMPVFMSGAIIVQKVMEDKVDTEDRRFAVIDRTGVLYAAIEAAARDRNERAIYEWREGERGAQTQPRFIPEQVPVPGSSDRQRLELELSDRVRGGQLFAYVVIGAGAVAIEAVEDSAVEYHSQAPTYRDLPAWLSGVINGEIQRLRYQEAQLDRALVEKLTRKTRIKRLGLVSLSEKGEVIKAQEESAGLTLALAAGSMMMLFMLVMMSAPTLLNLVLEEKMQRISEVLVASVSPFELLLGKLLGLIFVSMTLSLLYLSAAYGLLVRFQVADHVPPAMFGWFLLFQFLALLMFGSMFSGIGAACSELRDAQSLMGPTMLLLMLPMFCWPVVLESPSSPFATIASLVPPATPMLMLVRIAIPPGPPLWQVFLGVALSALFALLCVWAAAKIFRIGILSYGQAPTFARLAKWLVSG